MLEIGHLPKLSADQRRHESMDIILQNAHVYEILRPSIMDFLKERDLTVMDFLKELSFASYTDESGLTEILG